MTGSSGGSRTRTVKTPTRAPESEPSRRTSAPTAKLATSPRARNGRQTLQPQSEPRRPRRPSMPPPAKRADGGAYSVVNKLLRAGTSEIGAVGRRVRVAVLGGRVKIEVGDAELSVSRREASALLEHLYAALK